MTTAELKITSNYIQTLASQPDATERISLFLSGLLAMQPKDNLSTPKKKKKCVSTLIHFTQKEIFKMDKTFRKEFIANGMVAHVIKRKRGKNAIVYEIRYRKNGFDISATSANLDEAKRRFLKMTMPDELENHRTKNYAGAKNSFRFIANEWLEFKKDKLNSRTHKNYENYCQRYLYPVLGDMDISVIKTIDINGIMTKVEGSVYEDLRVVLNSVFKYALASGVITHNPMLLIPFKKAERNNRRAMTEDELKKMIERLNLPEYSDYKRTFLILLFFGLRPCELEDARFEGDFLIVLNAKHKTDDGDKVYKKIPIPKQARKYINVNEPIDCNCALDTLNRVFKKDMQDKGLRNITYAKLMQPLRKTILWILGWVTVASALQGDLCPFSRQVHKRTNGFGAIRILKEMK